MPFGAGSIAEATVSSRPGPVPSGVDELALGGRDRLVLGLVQGFLGGTDAPIDLVLAEQGQRAKLQPGLGDRFGLVHPALVALDVEQLHVEADDGQELVGVLGQAGDLGVLHRVGDVTPELAQLLLAGDDHLGGGRLWTRGAVQLIEERFDTATETHPARFGFAGGRTSGTGSRLGDGGLPGARGVLDLGALLFLGGHLHGPLL